MLVMLRSLISIAWSRVNFPFIPSVRTYLYISWFHLWSGNKYHLPNHGFSPFRLCDFLYLLKIVASDSYLNHVSSHIKLLILFFLPMSEHLSTVYHRCFNFCSTFWVFYLSFCLWEQHFLFPFQYHCWSFVSNCSKNLISSHWLFWLWMPLLGRGR